MEETKEEVKVEAKVKAQLRLRKLAAERDMYTPRLHRLENDAERRSRELHCYRERSNGTSVGLSDGDFVPAQATATSSSSRLAAADSDQDPTESGPLTGHDAPAKVTADPALPAAAWSTTTRYCSSEVGVFSGPPGFEGFREDMWPRNLAAGHDHDVRGQRHDDGPAPPLLGYEIKGGVYVQGPLDAFAAAFDGSNPPQLRIEEGVFNSTHDDKLYNRRTPEVVPVLSAKVVFACLLCGAPEQSQSRKFWAISAEEIDAHVASDRHQALLRVSTLPGHDRPDQDSVSSDSEEKAKQDERYRSRYANQSPDVGLYDRDVPPYLIRARRRDGESVGSEQPRQHACQYGDIRCVEPLQCRLCSRDHYHTASGTTPAAHCAEHCSLPACPFGSPAAHMQGSCGRCYASANCGRVGEEHCVSDPACPAIPCPTCPYSSPSCSGGDSCMGCTDEGCAHYKVAHCITTCGCPVASFGPGPSRFGSAAAAPVRRPTSEIRASPAPSIASSFGSQQQLVPSPTRDRYPHGAEKVTLSNKELERASNEFHATVKGERGQTGNPHFNGKSPVGAAAEAGRTAAKKLKEKFDPSNPARSGRAVVKALSQYDAMDDDSVALTKATYSAALLDWQFVADLVRKGAIVVQCSGPSTTLGAGCELPALPVRGPGSRGGGSAAVPPTPAMRLFSPAATPGTPGAEAPAMEPLLAVSAHAGSGGALGALAKRHQQGILSDQLTRLEFEQDQRFFAVKWDLDAYPLNCAMECASRKEQREFVWGFLTTYYPEHMFVGVPQNDVATAFARIAATTYVNGADFKDAKQKQFLSMRLGRNQVFETANARYEDEMAALEQLGVPVLDRSSPLALEVSRRDKLLNFLEGSPDFDGVRDDCKKHDYSYEELKATCVARQSQLYQDAASAKAAGRVDGHGGGNGDRGRGNGDRGRGNGKEGARHESARAATTGSEQSADLPPRTRPTASDKALAAKQGWDVRERVKGRFTAESDKAQRRNECYSFQLTGRCPFGDSCKYDHISKNGTVVTKGVQSDVPNNHVCRHCKCTGKHWSQKCTDRTSSGSGSRGRRAAGEKAHRAICVGDGGGLHLAMAAAGSLEELGVKANKDQVPVSTHENAWLGSIVNDVRTSTVYADSGASRTIVTKLDSFVYLRYSKEPFLIEAANGHVMRTHLVGTVRIQLKGDGGAWSDFTLTDVLYLPEAAGDLLSLGRLTASTYKATMHASVLEILHADPDRSQAPVLSVTAQNNVWPVSVRAGRRTPSEVDCVAKVASAHGVELAKDSAFAAVPRVVTPRHVGADVLETYEGEGYINHCKAGHRPGAAARAGLPDIPAGTCPHCMVAGMSNIPEADDGHRVAEYYMQYILVDAQGPFPVSVRGHRYWISVIDVKTQVRLSFPSPTLQLALVQLDAVLAREANRVNVEVQGLFKRCHRPRRLGTSVSPDAEQADLEHKEERDDAEQALNAALDRFTFAEHEGEYVRLSELGVEPRVPTVGVLRTDGAPSQRGAEMDKLAEKFGCKLEKITPYQHNQLGGVEWTHFPDLRGAKAQMLDCNSPTCFWCFFMENHRDACNYIPGRRGETLAPYALAHGHVAIKPGVLAKRCKRAGCLAYCYISAEVRVKMGVRGIAAILLCSAEFGGFKGYWFLSIEKGVLFLCSSFTLVETELPWRDPRVWAALGIPYGDREATFKVQSFAHLQPGYTNGLPKELKLENPPPPPLSATHGVYAGDDDLTADEKQDILSKGRRHRNKTTGLTQPNWTGNDPIVATHQGPVNLQLPALPPVVPAADKDTPVPSSSSKGGRRVRFDLGGDAAAAGSGDDDVAGAVEPQPEADAVDVPVAEYEVDRFYAPPQAREHECWQLVDAEGQSISVEEYVEANPDGEPSRGDYSLFVEASFVGYGANGQRDRSWVPHSGIADGQKIRAWNEKYLRRARSGLQSRITRDRNYMVKLRKSRTLAAAKLSLVIDMLAPAAKSESTYAEAFATLDGNAPTASSSHDPDAPKERIIAWKAWCVDTAIKAKNSTWRKLASGRHGSDVAMSSRVADIGTPGTPAPTVICPPRDLPPPLSLSAAFRSAYGPQWREAFAKEIAGLETRESWEVVPFSAHMLPLLSLKPVFKIKFLSDGLLDKFKIRLVVGGHRAIKGVHYNETFSPVMSIVVLRLVLSIFAAYPHVTTTVWDVEQAYLWSKLDEDVYVRAPTGMELPEGFVLRLKKAIYGMPQAGREFWKLLRGILLDEGFTQSEHAHCFFWKRTSRGFVIVMTYVDDITVTTDCPALRIELFAAINTRVNLEDRGIIKSFLGMDFAYNADELYWQITQETYILDLCATMGLTPSTSKAAFTPEVKRTWTIENSTARDDAERIRLAKFKPSSKLGMILWAIMCCRPDCMHAVKNPSQFVTDPGDAVQSGIERIARYLLGTASEGLRLYGTKGEVQLNIASDADDAGASHRRSMLCYVCWIGPPLSDKTGSARRAFFQWNNQWGIVVASGSMESEIYAIHAAVKGTASFRGLLGEIGLHTGKATRIAVDSASAKIVLQGEHSEKLSTGVKHIDRRVLNVRQTIAAEVYALDWVASEENPSDMGATFKSKVEFERLRAIIMGYVFPRSVCSYLRDTEEPSHWSKRTNTPSPATVAGQVE